jgi:hypothetical protein
MAAVACVSLFLVPWLAYRLSPLRASPIGAEPETNGKANILGGRRTAGFLVVDDGAALRHDIPTLHFSTFAAIVSQSRIEDDFAQGLIHPLSPPLPFGFIFAPRVESGVPSEWKFIVPADVLERPDIQTWRLTLQEWQPKPTKRLFSGPNWYYVTKAEPAN